MNLPQVSLAVEVLGSDRFHKYTGQMSYCIFTLGLCKKRRFYVKIFNRRRIFAEG